MGKFRDIGIGTGTSGNPQQSLEQNSYQSRMNHLNALPPNDAQIKHIFANRPGHLPDTPYNRHLVTGVANNPNCYSGQDKYGNDWYSDISTGGTQIWVKVHNDTISDAGKNSSPRAWDDETGYAKNPKKNNTWRNSR